MPVIKRYPNRKLYDTEAKQYITLEEIAGLIRRGGEVRVVDNATGEDLTALTLTQVILELEKKQSGFFPRSILTGLIQASGDRLNALQRSLTSSMSLWHQIDDEIRRRIQELINQGELTEGEGRNLIEKLLAQDTLSVSETRLQEDLERIMAQRQIPSHQDLQNLLDQLDSLDSKLEELRKENK
jgi:polyhydroxyalkanoate synthesis repressor PhaR